MISGLLRGTLGEILAPSPPASTQKKRVSEDPAAGKNEPTGQENPSLASRPQNDEDTTGGMQGSPCHDPTTAPHEPRAASSFSPVQPPPAMGEDLTSKMNSLTIKGSIQTATAGMPPPLPPGPAAWTPPPPESTPPSASSSIPGPTSRATNLLPAFSTPSKQTPGPKTGGSAARRRYTISPMLTGTPKTLEPALRDRVVQVGSEGGREGGGEGQRKEALASLALFGFIVRSMPCDGPRTGPPWGLNPCPALSPRRRRWTRRPA
jgi:hypothetical protein